MGKTIVVTGSFTVAWDADSLREEWGEPDMTDQELLEECQHSVEQDWANYASTADTVHIEADLIG